MNDFRPQRFEYLPSVIKNILIINGLIFLTKITFGFYSNDFMNHYLALHSVRSEYFKIYQLLSYQFLHSDFTHLFFNMFALWMFGAVLENIWGAKRFLTFYLLCGIAGGLCHVTSEYYTQGQMIIEISKHIQQYSIDEQAQTWQQVQQYFNIPTMGASASVFGCLLAFGFLFPNSYLYIYFFIPVKAKWFVAAYIFIEIFYLIMSHNGSPLDNIARIAHLGGALFAFIILWAEKKRGKNLF